MAAMCNYYQNDIRKAGREREYYGFDEFSEIPLDIYPDSVTGVIRLNKDGERSWVAMRWGFPPPPKAAPRPVTNVRNLHSPYWKPWLKPEFRCLAPFTRFAEYEDASPKGRKRLRWFHVQEAPMAAFAGIWRPWTGVRGPKANPVQGAHLLYAFLTCAPNAVAAPIHAKAMPVILTTKEAQEAWLSAPAAAVETLAQPLADDALVLEAA